MRLVELPRDLSAFDRARHADFANPSLVRAREVAEDLAELRGWSQGVRFGVDRALVIVCSGRVHGEQVRYSEVAQVRPRGLPVERTAEVIDRLGWLDDDPRGGFEDWLECNLAQIAPGMRSDFEAWLRALRDGGPRARPRSIGTAWAYFGALRPVLTAWCGRVAHLREVARDDVLAAVEGLGGRQRSYTLTALRSLFRFCRRRGTIFRDPTARIRVGRHEDGVTTPLR